MKVTLDSRAMCTGPTTWGKAVEEFLRVNADALLIRDCYWDEPLLAAARRFHGSREWTADRNHLGARRGVALDLGAGRGICSYALAMDGWRVTALEPDPSHLVGAGAIRRLAKKTELSIEVVEARGEKMPFEDASFDLVFARQVLHHAMGLEALLMEVSRVLKRKGVLLATREHVVSRAEDISLFQKAHPLHGIGSEENAYLVTEYTDAILSAGLKVKAVLGSFDSPINYFPMTVDRWRLICTKPLRRLLGSWVAARIASSRTLQGRVLLRALARHASLRDQTPGRFYSFLAKKV